jgi:hypothetical protein
MTSIKCARCGCLFNMEYYCHTCYCNDNEPMYFDKKEALADVPNMWPNRTDFIVGEVVVDNLWVVGVSIRWLASTTMMVINNEAYANMRGYVVKVKPVPGIWYVDYNQCNFDSLEFDNYKDNHLYSFATVPEHIKRLIVD